MTYFSPSLTDDIFCVKDLRFTGAKSLITNHICKNGVMTSDMTAFSEPI